MLSDSEGERSTDDTFSHGTGVTDCGGGVGVISSGGGVGVFSLGGGVGDLADCVSGTGDTWRIRAEEKSEGYSESGG